jgi:glycosyltransferase involved in cell wall biosynthesis
MPIAQGNTLKENGRGWNGKSNVIFCLPEGLTLGGVTTWSVELSRELQHAGFSTQLGLHPSRYNNPPVDFGIGENDHLIDCTHLPHPDDPDLNPEDYLPYYGKALPGILIPSWSWGTYAMAAKIASQKPDALRIIGMAHADESGYYQWLVHYESIIHEFIAVSNEIGIKLARLIPHRVENIHIKPCPVHVPDCLQRTILNKREPIKLVYAGRIANYQKRVFLILELIKKMFYEGINFHFRIIGGGADQENFYKRTNELPEKIRSLISLEDALPPSKMPEVWRTSDINIIVSDFEGTSVSMLEGMAEGCVPIVTGVSGTSEIIKYGENGYVVPVDGLFQMTQIIKMLESDRSLLSILGRNAHVTIKSKYSYYDYLPWFMSLMEKIKVEGPRPWPPANTPLPYETIHKEVIRLNEMFNPDRASKNFTKKKRILFVSHDANWGGAPKVLFSLIKGLDKNKWEPFVALPGHGELEDRYKLINVRTIITPMQYITTDIKKYWQQYLNFSGDLKERVDGMVGIIDQEGIDLVVTNTICIFEGALAAKFAGVPHVWYVHELSSKDDQLTPVWDYPTFYATMDSLSDKIVVVSKAVQEEILKFFHSGKLKVIYTGLENDEPVIKVDRKAILGVEPGVPVITFLGVISKRKGILDLVDAACIVSKRFPDVKFVIAGKTEGEIYSKLRQSLLEKHIDNNFTFLGFRKDIREVINGSDVIAVPSLIDPFPLAVLEAMESGIPVVATRSGGPEESVLDGETGILVPVNSPFELAQAMIRLLDDPGLRERMGKKGRERFVETFNYADYINHFSDVFIGVALQPRMKKADDRVMVENIIRMAAIAANANEKLSDLNQQENPHKTINDLLNYPGYLPYDIPPRGSGQHAPKVSVCIPVYNGARYIRDCIDSILSQSFKNFELVIVNDSSSDESEAIIHSYHDPRIKYFENERNLGLVGNWNKCLEYSSGEFVCIFHQDDVMVPNNLEKKASLLDSEKQVGLVYSDTCIINDEGQMDSDHWFNMLDPSVDFVRPGRSFFDLMMINLNIISCPSVMARRECFEKIGGFDARLPFSVDMEMWMRIALFFDVAYLAEPLIWYRFHENNLTHQYLPLDLIHVYLCKRILLEKYPEILDRSYDEILVEDSTTRILERAIHHYWKGEYKIAKQHLIGLKMIRNRKSDSSLTDVYIEQLTKYVDQANALAVIGMGEYGLFPAWSGANKNIAFDTKQPGVFSAILAAIKPYVPPALKKPLRYLRDRLKGQRKT